ASVLLETRMHNETQFLMQYKVHNKLLFILEMRMASPNLSKITFSIGIKFEASNAAGNPIQSLHKSWFFFKEEVELGQYHALCQLGLITTHATDINFSLLHSILSYAQLVDVDKRKGIYLQYYFDFVLIKEDLVFMCYDHLYMFLEEKTFITSLLLLSIIFYRYTFPFITDTSDWI
ncbi:hypothetical protein ACJX0J_036030, partial [Zea mays]